MNALWIKRMHDYINSPNAIESAKILVYFKIQRQNVLLKKYKCPVYTESKIDQNDLKEVLLKEARVARHFWTHFQKLIPKSGFKNRKPRAKDFINKLLDIGYHHLGIKVGIILDRHNIPTDLALLHRARSSKSKPLVYDLMEMFRSDIVDSEVLKFVRLKKKIKLEINQGDIVELIKRINRKLNKQFYIKKFHLCQRYDYYMELQILKFIKAVNHREIFKPISLPTRNEDRC